MSSFFRVTVPNPSFLGGRFNLSMDHFKMALFTVPLFGNPFGPTLYSTYSASEVGNGGGYTTGGQLVVPPGAGIVLLSPGELAAFFTGHATWTGVSGGFSAVSFGIYDDTDSISPKGMLCMYNFPDLVPISVGTGDTLNIDGFGGGLGTDGQMIVFQQAGPNEVEVFY